MDSVTEFDKLPKIDKVYVCMNHNFLVFDEEGRQLFEIQERLNFGSEADKAEVIRKIVRDKPSVYLADRWKKIPIRELIFLLGFQEGLKGGLK